MRLNPISIYSLTLLEAGQFINRQLTDIRALGGPEYFTDENLNNYLTGLDDRLITFNNALMVVRKSDETIKIVAQDNRRDLAFTLLKKTAAFYEISNEDDQREAALSLKTLFNIFKNLTKLNYEAESLGIDSLLNDLGNSKYAPMVDLLELGQAVDRLRVTNEGFKSLFGGRIQETSNQEVFDAKMLRNEIFAVYNDFATYVLTMAKLQTSIGLFTNVLNVMNIGRKYYSDMLARRKGVAAPAETV